MKEWLEHHLTLGVEHFYLYDHKSTDRSCEILEPYIQKGLVDLVEWPVEICDQKEYLEKLQIPVYNHALQIVKKTSRWAAFIDLDEFLVPFSHALLPELLKEYETYGGLAINWQMFGTAQLHQIPEGKSLRESLVWKAPADTGINQIIKLIVQPRFVQEIQDPHTFSMQENTPIVDSKFHPLKPGQRSAPIHLDTIQLNHYWLGTEEWFFQRKLPRLENWGYPITQEFIDDLLIFYNKELDTSICRFIQKL